MVRHRTANLNLQSGRYTPFEENDFHIPSPDAWRMQSLSNKQGSSDQTLDIISQKTLLDNLGYNGYENVSDLLQAFSDSSYAVYDALLKSGVAKEQARLFLPGFALYYEGVWKIDAHNLMNFLKLRLDSHAQYEIRMYAQAINEYFSYFMPWTKEAFELYLIGD